MWSPWRVRVLFAVTAPTPTGGALTARGAGLLLHEPSMPPSYLAPAERLGERVLIPVLHAHLACRCGSAFEVAVVAQQFDGKPLIQRHRLVRASTPCMHRAHFQGQS